MEESETARSSGNAERRGQTLRLPSAPLRAPGLRTPPQALRWPAPARPVWEPQAPEQLLSLSLVPRPRDRQVSVISAKAVRGLASGRALLRGGRRLTRCPPPRGRRWVDDASVRSELSLIASLAGRVQPGADFDFTEIARAPETGAREEHPLALRKPVWCLQYGTLRERASPGPSYDAPQLPVGAPREGHVSLGEKGDRSRTSSQEDWEKPSALT
jgi:hypothetical protein